MEKQIEVMIIGTEPPSPRCDRVFALIEEIANNDEKMKLCGLKVQDHLQRRIKVQHCAFDSLNAVTFGQLVGQKIGTAKHVAKDADIQVNWEAIYGLIDQKKSSLPFDCRPADTWSPDLDNMLEPCQKAAESAGYLMTPVLVINGKIVHHGSVPSRQQIAMWLAV